MMMSKIKELVKLKEAKKLLDKKIKDLQASLIDEWFDKDNVDGYTAQTQHKPFYTLAIDIKELKKKWDIYSKFIEEKPIKLGDLYKLDSSLVKRKLTTTIVVKKEATKEVSTSSIDDNMLDDILSWL